MERNNKELKEGRSGNTSDILTTYTEWRREHRNTDKIKNFKNDSLKNCFDIGYVFINTLIKMVAIEMKINPQDIREWSLSDLVDIVADILSKHDTELYQLYCNKSRIG